LGIRTVWLTGYTRGTRHRPAFVDVKVKSLNQLARQRRKLGAGKAVLQLSGGRFQV
jgi:hypothetical protein